MLRTAAMGLARVLRREVLEADDDAEAGKRRTGKAGRRAPVQGAGR